MKLPVYPFLSIALLAAGLAACSPDQPAQITQAPAPLPNAAAPAQALADLPAAPAPLPAPRSRTQAASHATRWVRRPAGPAQSTSLRAAATEVVPTAARENSYPPQMPEELASLATDSDLPAFCAQAAPQAQEFVVRPGRDTVLLGRQGTRLVIPGRAFDVPATSGPITLTMREFYSTADIVLAGLGTRAGLDVLETGGMLHLYAAANGQTVHLRPDKQVLVQLPTRQQLPGMNLYEGVSADASHAPDWQLAGTGTPAAGPNLNAASPANRAALGEWVKLHPPKSPRWPYFEKDKQLLKEYSHQLPNSKADQARLRRKRTVGKDEQRLLKELSQENHTAIWHAIMVDVVVDSAGVLQTSELVMGDSVLGAKVLAFVRQLPTQRAASFISTLPHGKRMASLSRGVFSVLYARSGRQLVGFSWLVMDKQLQEELAKDVQRRRAVFAKQFNNASTPLTIGSGLYYELAAGGLGWINCDRLLDPGPRILYTVATPDPTTVVSLVFKGQRSILASSRTEGSAAVFEQVPAGQAATVVALRREKGVTYLATSGVSLNPTVQPALSFHPVTLEQLRTELAQL